MERGALMIIKKGATRTVFVFNKFVIKIPNFQEYKLFLNGLLANLQEKSFSKMNRIDLAKVKYCNKFGFILIMEKAQELDVKNIDWLRFKERLEDKYKNDDMKEFMLSDSKPSNWGYINNKLVKIDYGN